MSLTFVEVIKRKQDFFGIELSDAHLIILDRYKDIVFQHNPLLHLTAPMSEEEFAVRHILESLTMTEFLPQKAKIVDVGAGAGLPSIPCLIVRSDLQAVLIESKRKKADFLTKVVNELSLSERTYIINQNFEHTTKPDAEFVCCRALDKFTQKLPKLLKWGKESHFLLFGSDNLQKALEKQKINFIRKKLPLSEKRFIFFIRSTA